MALAHVLPHPALLSTASFIEPFPSPTQNARLVANSDIPNIRLGQDQHPIAFDNPIPLLDDDWAEERLVPQLPKHGCPVKSNVICTLVMAFRNFIDIIDYTIQLAARRLGISKTYRNPPKRRLSDPSREHDGRNYTQLRHIPEYVMDYAPLVHLYSGEEFWPCDIAEHLRHVQPFDDYMPIRSRSRTHRNLTNIDIVNEYGGSVFLTSDDDVDKEPAWLKGQGNRPRSKKSNTTRAGLSNAPAILIVVSKPHGVVDAFWFFFYSFNLGNKVLKIRFGNHVGDWEYTLVRFKHGKPTIVYLSQHTGGKTYTYTALEKLGERPVVYSAFGTHAMYATPATHRYILPFGLLSDKTDRGPLWDPALKMYSYGYNKSDDRLVSSNITPEAPTQWFYFNGKWGDKTYRLRDTRQYMLFRERHYEDGPDGPHKKRLGRGKICTGKKPCEISDSLL